MKKLLMISALLCLGSTAQPLFVVGDYGVGELALLMDVVCSECKGCPRTERVAVAHVALRHRGILNQIERDVIAVAMGRVEDPTDGATYFHAKRLGRLWSGNVERVPVPQNWLHHFYRKAN